MDADYFPTATASNMKRWAAKVKEPLYAFHDDTAIKVVDGQIEVVSEGSWDLFNDGPNVAAVKGPGLYSRTAGRLHFTWSDASWRAMLQAEDKALGLR